MPPLQRRATTTTLPENFARHEARRFSQKTWVFHLRHIGQFFWATTVNTDIAGSEPSHTEVK
jgi:hypothetical protein